MLDKAFGPCAGKVPRRRRAAGARFPASYPEGVNLATPPLQRGWPLLGEPGVPVPSATLCFAAPLRTRSAGTHGRRTTSAPGGTKAG